jgi:shikimate kinase
LVRPVVLTGMMGAGKTSIASEVGRILGCRVVDLDDEVQRRSSLSVQEIFDELGESEFRRREFSTFLELLRGGFEILSLGGGAFMSGDVREAIRGSGATSVYLHAGVDTLVDRLSDSRAGRPLVASEDWVEHLMNLYEARDPTYRLADIVIETGQKSVSAVSEEVIDVLSA